MKKKRLIAAVLAAAILLSAVWLLGRLTRPKYSGDIPEGAMIAEYYSSEKDNDVIFLGDCEVFENISPEILEEKYGIRSYIRGSAQQLVWQSYYILEETLEYEKPDTVVYNVNALRYGETVSEAYNRMTLDGMNFSKHKICAVLASAGEDESILSYFIPLLRYHSRWSELQKDDFEYLFKEVHVSYRGYLEHTGIVPQEQLPSIPILKDPKLPEISMEYLEKMRLLCEANGVKLMLVKSPCQWPHWYEEWDEQITDYANAHDMCYINFIPLADEMDLDMSTDTYDFNYCNYRVSPLLCGVRKYEEPCSGKP